MIREAPAVDGWNIDHALDRVNSVCYVFVMATRPRPNQHVIRAYIRDVPGASARVQRERLSTAEHPIVEYGEDERDAWVRAIGPGATGWVYRLDLIATRAGKGKPRPSADFAATIADLSLRAAEGAVLIEGATGANTRDPAAWRAAVKSAHQRVMAGRRLTRSQATELGALGGKVMADNSAARRVKQMPREHASRIRALWRSSEYPNARAAAMAVSEYCRDHGLPQLGAWRTLQRALKGRR
jgi:hypothetical protein